MKADPDATDAQRRQGSTRAGVRPPIGGIGGGGGGGGGGGREPTDASRREKILSPSILEGGGGDDGFQKKPRIYPLLDVFTGRRLRDS